ncbi:MAG: hypothetical protein MZV64_51830 [Ignavibacteriales bacterium]|nr:hypothetical protein [Ignavibacteriales bacterium]
MKKDLNGFRHHHLINENYWNTRILAQYYGKMNKKSEAIATMEKAIELGGKMPKRTI